MAFVEVEVGVVPGKKSRAKRTNGIYIPYENESDGPSWFWIILLMIPATPIAMLLLGLKGLAWWRKRKTNDYRSYAAIIGNRAEVDVRELSAKLGKPAGVIMNDLKAMIERGYMGPDAYLDHSRGLLVIDASQEQTGAWTPQEAADTQPAYQRPVYTHTEPQYVGAVKEVVRNAPKEPQEAAQKPRDEEKVSLKKQKKALQDDFETKLRQIRELNEQIADEKVSEDIDRIGSLTMDIFRVVQQKPERADEVRKFMNYYLPVTFKLLEDYALMEKQTYQGENIRQTRDRIEGLLQTLIKGFEQQLDKLFGTEAMDVQADISVMETMLAKDGLVTPQGMDIHQVMTQGGH